MLLDPTKTYVVGKVYVDSDHLKHTQMTCDVISGNPKATHYTWTKDGASFQSNSQSDNKNLVLQPTYANTGVYECSAYNGLNGSECQKGYMLYPGITQDADRVGKLICF